MAIREKKQDVFKLKPQQKFIAKRFYIQARGLKHNNFDKYEKNDWIAYVYRKGEKVVDICQTDEILTANKIPLVGYNDLKPKTIGKSKKEEMDISDLPEGVPKKYVSEARISHHNANMKEIDEDIKKGDVMPRESVEGKIITLATDILNEMNLIPKLFETKFGTKVENIEDMFNMKRFIGEKINEGLKSALKFKI